MRFSAGCLRLRRNRQKSPHQIDRAIAEAFAQQAYTTIGNRDREIMRDPYLLGFEIVDKNEDNSRLVGVFAFRVNKEILMAVVFYLNGQCKGYDLLYRKGVNRFTLNSEKWVKYLLAQDEDSEGRAVSRNSGQNRARMNLGLEDMYTNPNTSFKRAAAEDKSDATSFLATSLETLEKLYKSAAYQAATPEERSSMIDKVADETFDIHAAWKEATTDVMGPLADVPMMLKQFLVDADMGKQAADLVSRVPEIGDFIELAGSLNVLVTEKQASTAEESSLTWHATPEEGWPEEKVAAFYQRGYLLEDKRAAAQKATAFETTNLEKRVVTANGSGVMEVLDSKGNPHKALCGPMPTVYDLANRSGGSSTVQLGYPGDNTRYGILFLDGPHKGEVFRCRDLDIADTPLMLEHEGDAEELPLPKGSEPKEGKLYRVWSKTLGCFIDYCDLRVYNVEKSGDATLLNSKGPGRLIVLRRDLDESDFDDSGRAIYGNDILFIEVGSFKCSGDSGFGEPIGYDDNKTGFRPLTPKRMMFPPSNHKSASITVKARRNGLSDVFRNNHRVCEDLTPRQLVLKLARDFHLPVEDAHEIADKVAGGGTCRFQWLAPLGKRAARWVAAGWADATKPARLQHAQCGRITDAPGGPPRTHNRRRSLQLEDHYRRHALPREFRKRAACPVSSCERRTSFASRARTRLVGNRPRRLGHREGESARAEEVAEPGSEAGVKSPDLWRKKVKVPFALPLSCLVRFPVPPCPAGQTATALPQSPEQSYRGDPVTRS